MRSRREVFTRHMVCAATPMHKCRNFSFAFCGEARSKQFSIPVREVVSTVSCPFCSLFLPRCVGWTSGPRRGYFPLWGSIVVEHLNVTGNLSFYFKNANVPDKDKVDCFLFVCFYYMMMMNGCYRATSLSSRSSFTTCECDLKSFFYVQPLQKRFGILVVMCSLAIVKLDLISYFNEWPEWPQRNYIIFDSITYRAQAFLLSSMTPSPYTKQTISWNIRAFPHSFLRKPDV